MTAQRRLGDSKFFGPCHIDRHLLTLFNALSRVSCV
nr:unnamed protein product [Callosobruchus analis]CAI5838190.1 unnamed protein product [Callosobruchus analis]